MWDSGDFIETFIADPANGFSDIFNSEGGERETLSSRGFFVSPPVIALFVICPPRTPSLRYDYLAIDDPTKGVTREGVE